MRMVTVSPGTGTGSGSVEAGGPGLVASTGQFASDMNLADGSPARYSLMRKYSQILSRAPLML